MCVPSMALILLVRVRPRVFTAKCGEPQVTEGLKRFIVRIVKEEVEKEAE